MGLENIYHHSDRISTYIKQAKQGEEAAIRIAGTLDQLEIDKTDVLERLELARVIREQGESAALALKTNFKKLNFLNGIKNCESEESRLALCQAMIKQMGDFTPKHLLFYLQKLNYTDKLITDYLALCHSIAGVFH